MCNFEQQSDTQLINAQLVTDFETLEHEDVKQLHSHHAAAKNPFKENFKEHKFILKEGVKECDPNVQQHSGYIPFKGRNICFLMSECNN